MTTSVVVTAEPTKDVTVERYDWVEGEPIPHLREIVHLPPGHRQEFHVWGRQELRISEGT